MGNVEQKKSKSKNSQKLSGVATTTTEDVLGMLIQGDRLPNYDISGRPFFFHISISTCRTAVNILPAAITKEKEKAKTKTKTNALRLIDLPDLKPWHWDFGGIKLFDVTTGGPVSVSAAPYPIRPHPAKNSIPANRVDSLIDDFLASKNAIVIDWDLSSVGESNPQKPDELRWYDFLGHELTRPAPWPQIMGISHAFDVPVNDLSAAAEIIALPRLKLPGETNFREPILSSFTFLQQQNVWQVEYSTVDGKRLVAFANSITMLQPAGRILSTSSLHMDTDEIEIFSQDWLNKLKHRVVETFRIGYALQDWVSVNQIDAALNKCFLSCALDSCCWIPQVDWTDPANSDYLKGSVFQEFVSSDAFDGSIIDPAVLLTNLKNANLQIADWKAMVEKVNGYSDWDNLLESNLRNIKTIQALFIEQLEFAYNAQGTQLTPAQKSHAELVLSLMDLSLRAGLQLVKRIFAPLLSSSDREELISNYQTAFETYMKARLSAANPTYDPNWQGVGDSFRALNPGERTTQLSQLITAASARLADVADLYIFPRTEKVDDPEISAPIAIQVDEVNQNGRRNSFRNSISGYGILLKQDNGAGNWRCLNMASPKLRGDADALPLAWLVPSKIVLDDDIRMAFVSYNNNPLAIKSPAAVLDDAVKKTAILDTEFISYEQVQQVTNPEFAKVTMLKFGGAYSVVPFPVMLGGSLPDWLVEKNDPQNFHPAVLKSLSRITPPSAKNRKYRREKDLGSPTFIQVSAPQELPEEVYPVAHEISDISLFSSSQSLSPDRITFKFSQTGPHSNSKVIEIPKFKKSTGIITIRIGDQVSKPVSHEIDSSILITNNSAEIEIAGQRSRLFSNPLIFENNFDMTIEVSCDPLASTRTAERATFAMPLLNINGKLAHPDTLEQQPLQKILLTPWKSNSTRALESFEFALGKPTVSIDCWYRWRARDKDLAPTALPPGQSGEIKSEIDSDIKKCIAAHFSTLAKAYDNPDVTYPLATVDPAASDTFFVELISVWSPSGTSSGPNPEPKFYAMQKDQSGLPSGKIRDQLLFKCVPGPSAELKLANGTVEVRVPKNEVWLLRVSPLYPAKFFDENSSDPRFSEAVTKSRLDSTGKVIDSSQQEYFKGDAFQMIVESAGEGGFADDGIERIIGDAITARMVMNTQTLTVSLDRDAIVAQHLASQLARVNVMSQVWRWDGRTIQDVPLSPQDVAADNYEIRDRPGDSATRLKKGEIVTWDEWGFKNRQNSDFDSAIVRVPYQNEVTTLFARDLTTIKRALYYRFKFQVFSRYYGLNENLHRSARFFVGGIPNEWLRVLIPFRFNSQTDSLPPPLVKFIVPLTKARKSDAKAADALIVLDEELFQLGGLGEFLEPTILETALNDKEFGPDPLLVGSIQVTPDPHQESHDNIVGFTYTPEMAYPPIRQSGFVLPAPSGTTNSNQGNIPLDDPSWYMAKYAFRRVVSQNWSYDLFRSSPHRTESKFTNGSWIQFLPSNKLMYGPVMLTLSQSSILTSSVNGTIQHLEWQNHGTGYDRTNSSVLFLHWLVLTALGVDYKGESGNEFFLGVFTPVMGSAGQYSLLHPRRIEHVPPATVRCRVLQLQVDKSYDISQIDWDSLFNLTPETLQDLPARIVRISEPIDATMTHS